MNTVRHSNINIEKTCSYIKFMEAVWLRFPCNELMQSGLLIFNLLCNVKLCSIIACVFYSIKTTIFSYSGKNLTAHLRNEFMKSCLPIMFTSCWQKTNRFSSKYPRVFFFYQNNQFVHMVPIYMFICSPNVKGLSIIDF